MNLSKTEKKCLRLALHTAIQWELSLIDAHRVGYPRGFTGNQPMVVPAEYRPVTDKCERRIAAYKVLIGKLAATSTGARREESK